MLTTITPGTNTFIIPDIDWSNVDENGSLRSAYFSRIDGTSICPTGFRVPTEEDWEAEKATWVSNDRSGAFASLLKLTAAGLRNYDSASVLYPGVNGYYWSSDADSYVSRSRSLGFGVDSSNMFGNYRARGSSIRYIKE
jgi:hypothetical protein